MRRFEIDIDGPGFMAPKDCVLLRICHKDGLRIKTVIIELNDLKDFKFMQLNEELLKCGLFSKNDIRDIVSLTFEFMIK